MADEAPEEATPALVAEDDRRTVHLRNDAGSPYKFPTLGIANHAPGEVLPISLRRDEPIPFGFTPVHPDDHEQVLDVDPTTGIEVTASADDPTSDDTPKKSRKSSSAAADVPAPAGASPDVSVASEPVNDTPAEEPAQ